MPTAVSKKQFRLMMAIKHGKIDPSKVKGGRGVPPKSIAEKYTYPGKDAPEQSGQNRGGSWTEEHHARHAAKEKSKKKDKKYLKKAFEDYYQGQAAASIIMDDNNRVLLGRHKYGGLAFPGGHMDSSDFDHEITALREMKEESGLIGRDPKKVYEHKSNGNQCVTYLVESFTGIPKSTEEIKDWKWYEPHEIPWEKLRDCCVEPLEYVVKQKLGKSLKGLLVEEALQKNIIRSKGDAVFEVTHGDALKVVGNGLFRLIREATKNMEDEEFKDFKIDTHTISIRKHVNDVYSGRVNDGHKTIYQFTNKSLPELTVALMSLFEWYSPEDEKELEILDDSSLSDDAIKGGLSHLMENYKRHNIGNIYHEMEDIREQIRHGVAVDLQQVEGRMMKLFDKLEDLVHTVASKHNELSQDAGKEIDEIEQKLRLLQSKMEELEKKPEIIEAYSPKATMAPKIHNEEYPYLPKPQVDIMPDGRIRISFASEWTNLEKENFLKDLRAKVIKKSVREDDK